MRSIIEYLKEIFYGVLSLLKGMRVTAGILFQAI